MDEDEIPQDNTDSTAEKNTTSQNEAEPVNNNDQKSEAGSILEGEQDAPAEDSGSILEENANEEGKQEETGEGKEEAPIEYGDFEFPENEEIDNEMLDTATTEFKALKLPKEKAQKMLNLGMEAQRRAVKNEERKWYTQTQGWGKQVMNDPDIGGNSFKQTCRQNASILKKYDPDGEFTKFMNQTQIANHPGFNKFLNNIYRDTSEDTMNRPSSGRKVEKELTDEEILFPELAEQDRRVREMMSEE